MHPRNSSLTFDASRQLYDTRGRTMRRRDRISRHPSRAPEIALFVPILRKYSMQHLSSAATLALVCAIAIAPPAIAQTRADDSRFQAAQQRLNSELALFGSEFSRYQQARSRNRQGYRDGRDFGDMEQYRSDDRDERGYDPAQYYREGPAYQERALASDDRVYRGNDGRYYCKRNDGTTGLIVGAVGGGILGNVIDGGHSRTAGTLIGGAIGALAGRSIDQNSSQVRCR